MPSSEIEHARAVAEHLLGQPLIRFDPGGHGGNNHLWRASGAGGTWAVKRYIRHPSDPRDRLKAESDALRFLAECAEPDVPRLVAVAPQDDIAIHSWVDGVPAEPRGPDDVAGMAAFMERLRRFSPQGGGLPPASEACLSGRELERQINARLTRLVAGAAKDFPALNALLSQDLPRAIAQAVDRARTLLERDGQDFDADLDVSYRTLSPSDFGTHNALRRPDGSLVYVDFEYFGWDDPVKLVADTVLHPGMVLSAAERQALTALSHRIYADDPGFATRLRALSPLYALRWALIVLNPFLPERWARTARVTQEDREHLLRDRLRKAQMFLALSTLPLNAMEPCE